MMIERRPKGRNGMPLAESTRRVVSGSRTRIVTARGRVPLGGRSTGVSAEGFALAGDVHLWRRQLAPSDYTVPTPDGRAATRELAGERLARVVCGDREILDEAAIDAIAEALWDAQVTRIAEAVGRVRRRHPGLGLAVVTGLGDFLAAEAARRAALRVTHLSAALGPAARHAPAAAAALLLAAELAAEPVTS